MTTSNYAANVEVHVAFNAGARTDPASRTWTDISDYVELSEGITIAGGRADERSTCDANSLALTVDNSDGRFTPGLASGAYYPNVLLGRPIRVVARYPSDTVGNMLTANAASFETSVADWAFNTVLGTYGLGTSLARSATRAVNGTYSCLATWATHATGNWAGTILTNLVIGKTYTFAVSVWVPSGDADVRAEVAFIGSSAYTSTKNSWVRLSVTFTAVSTFHYVGVGAQAPTTGDLCYIDAAMVNEGSTAATFTTTMLPERTRFQGFVDEWPVEWPEGVDSYATATIGASSRMARLGAANPIRSMVEETTLALDPAAYYTMGDAEGSDRAADSTGADVEPLMMSGHGTAVVFGTNTGVGTDGLTAARLAAGGKTLRDVITASTTSAASVSLFYSSSASITVTAAEARGLSIEIVDTYVTARTYDGETATNTATEFMAPNDGTTRHYAATWDGTTLRLYVDGVEADTDTTTAGAIKTGSTKVGGASSGTGNFTVCHLAVFDTVLTAGDIAGIAEAGLTGFDNEAAADRLTRILRWGGVAASEIAASATATTPVAFFDTTGANTLDSARKVETTEGGVLFDAHDGATTLLARSARYEAATELTLSFNDAEVGIGAVEYDRTNLVNDATATWTGGTVRALDAASVDVYDPATASLELATDDPNEATSAAWWLVNNYATPVSRIPSLDLVDLTMLSTAKLDGALGLDVGSRITVNDWPTQSAWSAQDFFVEGYSEVIGLESHRVSLNVSPASIWLDVFIVQDATQGEIDSTYRLAW